VEHTLSSGQVRIGRLYSFAISNGISHTFFTLAPSTKVFILSRAVFSHFSSESFIEAAPSGSTQIIFVFISNAFVADIIHAESHHHHTGHMIKSGSNISNISFHTVACPVMILGSSNGCTKVAPVSFSNFLLHSYASSNVSQNSSTFIYFPQNCFVLYIFCFGVVIGIYIVPLIFK
jgi:hypothetical protein